MNGIDLDALPLQEEAGDDLVVFGRIHPDKGIVEAIDIARTCGRRLEVVDEGVTGFLVDDVVQAVRAVERAAGLDRRPVRAKAAARFGVDRMVDEYARLYERIAASISST